MDQQNNSEEVKDTENPNVDNPRTFPLLKELEDSFIGDLERTFSALALLEEKRLRGEESRHEKLSKQRIQKIDMWGKCYFFSFFIVFIFFVCFC